MPFAIASIAAIAIGGMALFNSAAAASHFLNNDARSLPANQYKMLRTLQKSIEKYEE